MEGGRYFRTGAYEKEKYFIEGMHLLCILIYLINVKKYGINLKNCELEFLPGSFKEKKHQRKISNRPARHVKN